MLRCGGKSKQPAIHRRVAAVHEVVFEIPVGVFGKNSVVKLLKAQRNRHRFFVDVDDVALKNLTFQNCIALIISGIEDRNVAFAKICQRVGFARRPLKSNQRFFFPDCLFLYGQRGNNVEFFFLIRRFVEPQGGRSVGTVASLLSRFCQLMLVRNECRERREIIFFGVRHVCPYTLEELQISFVKTLQQRIPAGANITEKTLTVHAADEGTGFGSARTQPRHSALQPDQLIAQLQGLVLLRPHPRRKAQLVHFLFAV